MRFPGDGMRFNDQFHARDERIPVGRAHLAILAVLVGSPFARADPVPRAHIIYVRERGAERCPDEEATRAAVAARLGYNPFSLLAARTVTVAVRGIPGGLQASIELADALGDVSGRRHLSSPRLDCGELASALELAIALAIDPLGAMRGDSAPRETPPPATPAVEQAGGEPTLVPPPFGPEAGGPPPAAVPRRRPLPPGEKTRVRVGAGALVALGSAPSVAAAGFTLQFGFRQALWSLNIEARGDLPGSLGDPPGRVSTALVMGWLIPCLHVPVAAIGPRRLEFAGCGLFGAGAQIGRGQGYDTDSQVIVPFVAGGLRAGLEIPLARRFAAALHGDFVLPATRLQLQVQDHSMTRTPWTAPVVSGAFGLALLAYFR